MTPHEKSVRDLVLEWIDKAEDDYVSADRLLSHESPRFGPIAFLAQQCAEKYLKAFLVAHEVKPPRTHSIEELLDLLAPIDAEMAKPLRDVDRLSPYGVDIRCPDDVPEISPKLAREAVDLASKVRDAVREALREYTGEPPA